MDTLCNGHEVQLKDLDGLYFPDAADRWKNWTGKCTRIESRSGLWRAQAAQASSTVGWLNITEAVGDDYAQWDTWLNTQKLYDASSVPIGGSLEEDQLAVVVLSPVFLAALKKHIDSPTALRYSPLQRDCLLLLSQRLFIHQAYFSLLEEGSPCAMRIDAEAEGRPCQFFLLRTSNAVGGQSAIAVTHFPSFKIPVQGRAGNNVTIGARTNVLISGYNEQDLEDFIANLGMLNHFPSAPSQFITNFINVEKEKCFRRVRETVREMQTVIHDLAKEAMKAPSARQKLNETVSLYFVVHHLRTDRLVSWRDQLKLLRDQVSQKGDDQNMVMYLDQQISRYDHRIGRCDMVLQGASLAYQMETTQLSRKDTEIAIGDTKTMKAIAVLTLLFLPDYARRSANRGRAERGE
ncbi:hypothetical protein B0T14DRAFT_335080 [Immersiella caudata]|uniref:Uncharacterized protein n=1 Tax=Immersiella caudata TaxID=314043 RepID=A0AA39U656_9PEZI|nr:hypothetical protein B0T14DRAFT_335080 [Immersiella caudata]